MTYNEFIASIEKNLNELIKNVEFDSVAPFDEWTDELKNILINLYKSKIELINIQKKMKGK